MDGVIIVAMQLGFGEVWEFGMHVREKSDENPAATSDDEETLFI